MRILLAKASMLKVMDAKVSSRDPNAAVVGNNVSVLRNELWRDLLTECKLGVIRRWARAKKKLKLERKQRLKRRRKAKSMRQTNQKRESSGEEEEEEEEESVSIVRVNDMEEHDQVAASRAELRDLAKEAAEKNMFTELGDASLAAADICGTDDPASAFFFLCTYQSCRAPEMDAWHAPKCPRRAE